MKILLSIIVAFFSILIFQCCSNQGKDEINQKVDHYLQKELIIPENIYMYDTDSLNSIDSTDIFSSSYKIVTLIDGSCGSCLEYLNLWNNFIRRNSKIRELSYLILIESQSGFETFKYIINKNNVIQYPVFIDNNGLFRKLNELPDESIYHTFLVDKKTMLL